MIILEDILSQEVVQRLGWTLLHFVWQAAVLALLVAILLKVLRKSTANLRYIIACLALVLIVLLPVITIQLVPVSVPQSAGHIEPAPAPAVLSIEEMPPAETTIVEEPEQLESVAPISAKSWKQRTIDTLEPALPYIVSGWLIGVFALSIWHLGGWAQLQQLRRRMVKQVDTSLHSKLKVLAKRLRVNRTVQLMESALVQIPTVVGWLRPVILLPASALTGLSSEQLEAILAHELAHIKRFDYLINILQTVVEILGFYHPAVWWVSHKIRAERENCCDDLAVSISGDRVCYARALTSMEEIRAGRGQLAVAATGGNLFRRIRRLVSKDSTEKTSFSWVPAATVILLIIALAIPTTLALTTKSDSMLTETKTDVQVEDKSAEASEVRIVHFPKERAVGMLKVRDVGSDDYSDRGLLSLPGWVILGQAQGDVSVPAGKDLRLEIYYEEVADLSFLADLKPDDLQVLMSNTETTDDDLVHIKGLTGLLGLDLGSTAIKDPGLVHLSTLTSLRKLSFFNTQVSDAGLAHLSTLKSLKYLNLYITQVRGPGLKHLKSLTSLVHLDLAATPITNESLVYLAEMTWLKKLELQDTDIGNKGLANLKPLRSLEELILGYADLKQGYSPITDEGLVYLKELGSLKHLYLLRTRVTDAGLAHLRNLKKLEALVLTETQITGEGLAFLKDLPELKYLDLKKTAVTDKVLVFLKDLKSLSKLYISSDSISEADLEDLEKALPNCTINGRRVSSTVRPPKPELILAENIPTVLPTIVKKSPTPSAKDKTHVQVDCLIVEVSLDLKMDRETTVLAENLLGNKISLRDTKVDVLLRKAAEATAATKDKSTENKRVTEQEFNALVEMLASRGLMKILMNPTLEVLNGKTAIVKSSQHVPIDTMTMRSTESGYLETKTKYEDVTDSLEITPHVFADGHITLQVEATISSRSIPKGIEQIPIVTKREISTRAHVSPGESLIIGGIKRTEKSNVKDSKEQTKEVLFIITPTIIIPASNSQEKTEVPVEQEKTEPAILIETRFLSVSEDFLKDIGLDANSVHDSDVWSEHLVANPAAEPNSETYSLILDDLNVRLLLKAVQAHQGSKMLAAPQVLCQEGKTASIAVLTEEYYVLGYTEPNGPSDEPESKKDKVEIGTRIWLKPELTPDNENVRLDFKLEIRQLLGYEERKYKGKYKYIVPLTKVVSTQTQLGVPDGKTLLIGGLKITEQVESRSSAPLLSKIPVIGKAFRSRSTIKDHKMLLILVKPIINPQQKAKKILPGQADSEEHIKSLARQLEKKIKRHDKPK